MLVGVAPLLVLVPELGVAVEGRHYGHPPPVVVVRALLSRKFDELV